jgi:tripartite-type tricarboxylate transporter receptor subunit TctC
MARSPEWKEILKQRSWGDAYLDGAAFEEFLRSERASVERAYRAAGMLK